MYADIKDVIMFALGAGGFLHELFFGPIERPYVIAGSLALMGAPLVINGAKRVRNGRNGNGRGDA